MHNRLALAHKLANIRHLLHAASEVEAGCPSVATGLRARADDLLAQVQAEVQADTNEQTGDHWTHDLTEEQVNAVLDAVNAGQPFDCVLKRVRNPNT